MTTTEHIKLDIKAHNCFMTDEHLNKMDNIQLLRNTHPLYRLDFAKLLLFEGTITEYELNKFKPNHK